MLNLKKTAVAVLALSSSAVFAGSMGPVCSAVNVTVPCESSAWEVGARALYFKAQTGDNTGYNPIVDTTSILSHAPNYNWGFQIEGAYHFSTGNDININWYHLSNSTDKTISAQTSSFVGPTGYSTTTTVNSGALDMHPKWDSVNMEFGQHVDFGDNKAIRFHGGAQYARVADKIDSTSNITHTATGALAALSFTGLQQTQDYHHTYNGFGPRVGMDMSYDWGNGLGIYANGATSLLAGTRSYSLSYSNSVGGAQYFSESRTAIVPELDAKLGVSYTYAMAQGDLTLDAAWMWINYFNVRTNVAGNVDDFALQGPMFGLKWTGNVA